jgi:hypothetical protein
MVTMQVVLNGSSIGNKLIVLLPAPINPFALELVIVHTYAAPTITISAFNCTELPPPPQSCNVQVGASFVCCFK